MMKLSSGILTVTLGVLLVGASARAQTAPAAPKPTSDATPAKPNPGPNPDMFIERTFFLKNVSQASDANEVFTVLRNLLPAYVKTLYVPSQHAIVVRGMPEDLAATQKLLDELDRQKKTYRLTFTVAEMDGAKVIGTQHFAMVAVAGQMTTMKQGSKVPIATGSYSAGGGSGMTGNERVQTQFTYVDAGMTFDAMLDEAVNGAVLKSRVEDSGFQEDKSSTALPGGPVVTRNMSLEGSSFLTPGKPLMLGSLDVPGSTRRLDVQVVMEQLP